MKTNYKSIWYKTETAVSELIKRWIMNKIEKENTDYKNFLNEVLQQIENAKIQAASGINKSSFYSPTRWPDWVW